MDSSIPEWVYDSPTRKSELEKLESIQQENLEEFEKLQNSIKDSSVFKQCFCGKIHAECNEMKGKYKEEENNCLALRHEANNGYNRLLKEEYEIKRRLHTVRQVMKQLDSDHAKMESNHAKILKLNAAALNEFFDNAVRQYADAFGLDLFIEEVDDDTFWAVFTPKEKNTKFFKLLINKVSNKVIDIETTCGNSEDIKSKVYGLNCCPLLISDLRKLALD